MVPVSSFILLQQYEESSLHQLGLQVRLIFLIARFAVVVFDGAVKCSTFSIFTFLMSSFNLIFYFCNSRSWKINKNLKGCGLDFELLIFFWSFICFSKLQNINSTFQPEEKNG